MTKNIRHINNATDRIIIMCYPRGSGGKFLINCLALSQKAVLQDAKLAQQQLSGNLDTKAKFQLLIDRVRDSEQQWNDLGMGCGQLFHDIGYDKPIMHARFFHFHPVVHDLSWGNNYFFLTAHSLMELRGQLAIWTNAKVVMFHNTDRFLKEYRTEYLHPYMTTWQRIKGESWPAMPPDCLDEYWQLPDGIRQELDDMGLSSQLQSMLLWKDDACHLKTHNQREFSDLSDVHWWYKWDCDQYLDRDSFHHGIQTLYQILELEDYSPDLVLSFYDGWISRVQALDSLRVR